MPITEDRIAKLREFGLSEYAARAYLALLDLGLTEARDISTLSKVPTSKIYHILEQLHERGLCIILPEFPKKYAPVPFSDYLDKLQTQHEEAARAIDHDREHLQDMFAVAGDVDVGDRGTFTVLRGRRNVLSKMSELIRETSREMFVMSTVGSYQRMEYYLEDTRDATERGVQVRFLTPLSKEALPHLDEMAQIADIRDRTIGADEQGANVSIALFDNERALVINFLPDDGHLYQGKDTAFFTNHEAMVAALRSIVEPHWKHAPSLTTRSRQLAEGRMPEFTRLYNTREEAFAAFREALDRGVEELVGLRGSDYVEVNEEGRGLVEGLSAAGKQVRAVVHVTTPKVMKEMQALSERLDGLEVRHLEETTPTRYWVLDEREAFFSLAQPGGTDDPSHPGLIVHTSNSGTVEALRSQFESVWGLARPLDQRAQELDESGEAGMRTRFLPIDDSTLTGSRDITTRAKSEMMTITSPDGVQTFAESEDVQDAATRGVKVRVLMEITEESADYAREAASFAEVRHVPRVALIGNAADGREAFLVLPRTGAERDDGNWRTAASVAVHSTDPVYVRAFEGFFEAQWAVGKPIDERLDALGLPPTPRKRTSRNIPVS